MRNVIYLVFLTVVAVSCNKPSNTLFRLVPSGESGVTFINKLDYENDSVSILDFEYKYNGAGVSLGDINNDGLPDLFFTGNMVSSRLYLNKGNLKFEDITENAGVSTNHWATGSAMVDINQDGYLDIYVCMGGHRYEAESVRANLLFINNGDNTFTESAADYGLDDQGYGVQSVFFDYDKDGDLDMYLLQNGLVSFNRNTPREIIRNGKPPYTDKLFRNNGDNTFTNVSLEAGIVVEGFGLGVEVNDFNNDGWPDVYVSNDFLTNDLIYINNQDGTFTESARKMLKHQTLNGMGNDVADINNDGFPDITVLDMLPEDNQQWKLTMMGNNYDVHKMREYYGYQPQYMRNTLQLNNGNGTFSEIGQLAGIHATDWSWSVLFADYDNNGLLDPFITNGYRQNITDLDFITYSRNNASFGNHQQFREERIKVLKEIEGVKRHNYMYVNNGDLTFSDVSSQWGFDQPTYSNGAAYGDLDNDGDLDLVISNIDEESFIYENTLTGKAAAAETNYLRITFNGPAKNRQGYGTKVHLYSNGMLQYQYFSPWRGYLSSVEPVLHFGLGKNLAADSILVTWPDGKVEKLPETKANQELVVDYKNAGVHPLYNDKNTKETWFNVVNDSIGIEFVQKENMFVDFKLQPVLLRMHSQEGPGMAVSDVNGDGLEDFYFGGAIKVPGRLFVQNTNGTFSQKPTNIDSVFEEMGSLFFDVENDGDMDLYVVSGGSAPRPGSPLFQDHLYLNDGKGDFTLAENSLPDIKSSGGVVTGADFDKDGDIDLFVGGRVSPGEYPNSPESFLLQNNSKGENISFVNITDKVAPGMARAGMVSSALWTDFNNDGWIDLITVGEFAPVRFYQNTEGNFTEVTESTGLMHTNGWWNSISGADFDKDGDIDYIVGNLGLNSYCKATPEQPLELYAADFDNNGRIDPIVTHYVQGEKQIIHTRDDIIEQMSAMRVRFKTYKDFATTPFKDAFLPEEIEMATVYKAEKFQSAYIENKGDGHFEIRDLPVQAQFGPVHGILIDDYNGNGQLDVILVGNSRSTEPNFGNYDALTGVFLEFSENNFIHKGVNETGFFSDGNARSFVKIKSADGSLLLLTGNNQGIITKNQLKLKPGQQVITFPEKVSYVEIEYTDGSVQKREIYHGEGYLSQSSGSILINDKIKNVKAYDAMGNPLRTE